MLKVHGFLSVLTLAWSVPILISFFVFVTNIQLSILTITKHNMNSTTFADAR